MDENWAEAYQATQNAVAVINEHGAYAAFSGPWSAWTRPLPGTRPLPESMASLRRDRAAVDAIATMTLHNFWFTDELRRFLPLGDSLLTMLEAASR